MSSLSKRNGEVCIFTIASRNYLHYARTLLSSVRKYCPEAKLVVGLCDDPGEQSYEQEIFDVIELRSLDNIPKLDKFIFRYNILELNTAIKPYIFEKLFDQGYSKVIYFDPDICVYSSLDDLLAALDSAEMILTPHLSAPLDDDKSPTELDVLRSGTFNLGFVGMRNTEQMRRCAKWWQSKLYKECIVDIENGLFVDQKWMDLAPSLFSNVCIVKNEGWNVAYWNIKHRRITRDAKGNIFANNDLLVFYHFSGFMINNDSLAKHQNRFTKKDCGDTLEELCDQYAAMLIENGYFQCRNFRYKFDRLTNGVIIPDFARTFYREEHDWESDTFEVWTKGGDEQIIKLLNAPAKIKGQHDSIVTNLAYEVYKARKDLRDSFPDLRADGARRYAQWFIENAQEQIGLDRCFVEPLIVSLHTNQLSAIG